MKKNQSQERTQERRAVLVCTDKRGVFFGYVDPDAPAPKDGSIVLLDARMIVYWSPATKGVLGLAATGPAKGSKVTASVPRLELAGVTAVGDCTPEAVKKMEAGPWA